MDEVASTAQFVELCVECMLTKGVDHRHSSHLWTAFCPDVSGARLLTHLVPISRGSYGHRVHHTPPSNVVSRGEIGKASVSPRQNIGLYQTSLSSRGGT